MSSGPSADTRERLFTRAGGACELCGGSLASGSAHHRRPRQMGGTKAPWINALENLLAICGSGTTGCHGEVESHREQSYETGRLVRSGTAPWEVPFMDRDGRWWLLVDDNKLALTLPFNNPSSLC